MSKTYLIVSDTHGDTTPLLRLAGSLRPLDGILHLGDHAEDLDDVRAVYPEIPLFAVRGNNDWEMSAPSRRILLLGGKKIMMTHGHHYRVKMTLDMLISEARQEGAEAVLFGHTHRAHLERQGALWVANPGALRRLQPQYALMEIDAEEIKIKLCTYEK